MRSESFLFCAQISLVMDASKSEAGLPGRSPLSSPGYSGRLIASPSALSCAATSGIGERSGLGGVEECVQGSGVLPDFSITVLHLQ